jgi:hypothetical protein
MQWVEKVVIEELINITTKTTKTTTHEEVADGLFQNQPRYYVNMLRSSIITKRECNKIKNLN